MLLRVESPTLTIYLDCHDHANSKMAPTFSKVAVLAAPGMTLISGLRCLFSTFDDLDEHAVRAHSGDKVVASCTIYERLLETGEVQLYRVLESRTALSPASYSDPNLMDEYQQKTGSIR